MSLMEPLSGAVMPYDVSLDISYVSDPWGGKIEMIEWTGLWKSLPGRAAGRGRQPRRVRRRGHGRSRAFYERLGFDELFFESTEFFEPMAPWYQRRPARPAHDHDAVGPGGGHRAVSADAARPGLPGRVGTPRPDGVRRRRLEPRARLPAAAAQGVEPAGEPQTIELRPAGQAELRVPRRSRRPVRLAGRVALLAQARSTGAEAVLELDPHAVGQPGHAGARVRHVRRSRRGSRSTHPSRRTRRGASRRPSCAWPRCPRRTAPPPRSRPDSRSPGVRRPRR